MSEKVHNCEVLVVGGGWVELAGHTFTLAGQTASSSHLASSHLADPLLLPLFFLPTCSRPIGLFTAYLLQRQGIKTIICERNESCTAFPKMDITNARSMELFRSAGLAEKIRDAAVPRDRAIEVLWTTGLNTKTAQAWELALFRYDTTVGNNRRILATNDGSMPAEPAMRMSQVVLEPLVKKELDEAQAQGKPIDVWFGWGFRDLVQDETGVTAYLENKNGEKRTVRCLYLAGCDGGSSKVRRVLGQEKCWWVARRARARRGSEASLAASKESTLSETSPICPSH